MDAIDPALRRSGRFDAEIEVTTPTEEERLQILKVAYKSISMSITWVSFYESISAYVSCQLMLVLEVIMVVLV